MATTISHKHDATWFGAVLVLRHEGMVHGSVSNSGYVCHRAGCSAVGTVTTDYVDAWVLFLDHEAASHEDQETICACDPPAPNMIGECGRCRRLVVPA